MLLNVAKCVVFWVETGGDIMDQPYISHGNQSVVNGWLFQDAIELQKEREALEQEKEKLEQDKEQLTQSKEELERLRMEFEERQKEYIEQKKELEALKVELQLAKNRLEATEKSISMREEFEKQRQERSDQLFQMKWKMLEEELMKLAEDKKEFERMKQSSAWHTTSASDGAYASDGRDCSVFFTGVHNELALKKRYRDLMKIFHPDNIAGDHDVVVEISREFENMKEQMCME